MGHEIKLQIKNSNQLETRKIGSALLAGGFLVFIAFLAVSDSSESNFPSLGLLPSLHTALPSPMTHNASSHQQLDATGLNLIQKGESVFNLSNKRSDVYEMYGDIRIRGSSSSILIIPSTVSERNKSWHIKPHPRKGDAVAMSTVSELSINFTNSYQEVPHCALNGSIPAIIFSIGGYTGNLFHDFTDVLIPLFITSHRFGGEVQFLVSDMNPWWIAKFQKIFKQLSRYKIIDLNKDDIVLCFTHVVVGLQRPKDLIIGHSRAPKGEYMVNFTQQMRKSYSLERDYAVKLGLSDKKPRLVIIARKRTRSFTNLNKIVQAAKELGYETVVAEADATTDIAAFARIVNSCDVMMGVHGAGLTNLVFLPVNAIVIQVVPLGALEGIAWGTFGFPAMDSKLRYLQYSIKEEESSLIDLYPRDHPVLKDPTSIHKQGWNVASGVYLRKQNVKLNVTRFKAVLLQALNLLHY